MKNLAKAVLNVMADVDLIEKNTSVWTGRSAYKWVADKDVKKIIGRSMESHWLCLLPIGIDDTVTVDSRDEEYNGVIKHKKSVFTTVKTKYLLLHESWESIEIMWYWHGADSQDKGAGKATTYALKYAMLYTFLVPTGDMDDTDNTHSSEIEQKIQPDYVRMVKQEIAKHVPSDCADPKKFANDFIVEKGGLFTIEYMTRGDAKKFYNNLMWDANKSK